MCSIAPSLTAPLVHAVERLWQPKAYVVGPGLKTGLSIKINDPAQLGGDLVCMAAALIRRHTCPALLVSIDDVITLSYLDKQEAYAGALICPGPALHLDALTTHANLLTPVDLRTTPRLIGSDTGESVRAGILHGTAAMLDGLIARVAAERPLADVIVTGAAAPLLLPYCTYPMLHDPDLLCDGLYIIYARQPGADPHL